MLVTLPPCAPRSAGSTWATAASEHFAPDRGLAGATDPPIPRGDDRGLGGCDRAGGGQRDRDLRRAGIGAKAQIDAQHIAVLGALLQQLHDAFRQAHIKRLRGRLRRQSRRVRIEQDDEIDVAGVIELARAVFAEREDDEAAAVLRRIARRQRVKGGLRTGVVHAIYPVDARGALT